MADRCYAAERGEDCFGADENCKPEESGGMKGYLEKLQRCGVTVSDEMGFVRIGYSVYVMGRYVNHNDDWSLVLKPVYRTDWARKGNMQYPALLPAQYKRNPNGAVFTHQGNAYFIAGYNTAEQCIWLHPVIYPDHVVSAPRFILMHTA